MDNTLEIFFPQPCDLYASYSVMPCFLLMLTICITCSCFIEAYLKESFFQFVRYVFSYKFDTNGFLMHSDFSLTNIIFFSQQYLAINEAAYIAFLLIL